MSQYQKNGITVTGGNAIGAVTVADNTVRVLA